MNMQEVRIHVTADTGEAQGAIDALIDRVNVLIDTLSKLQHAADKETG
jgi:hypothetical protein